MPVNMESLDAVGGPCGTVEELSICKIDKRGVKKKILKPKNEESAKSCYRVNIEVRTN